MTRLDLDAIMARDRNRGNSDIVELVGEVARLEARVAFQLHTVRACWLCSWMPPGGPR